MGSFFTAVVDVEAAAVADDADLEGTTTGPLDLSLEAEGTVHFLPGLNYRRVVSEMQRDKSMK